MGGRALRSVQTTYRDIKIKAAMKFYYNLDTSMEAVRLFEAKSVRGGWHLFIKDTLITAARSGIV